MMCEVQGMHRARESLQQRVDAAEAAMAISDDRTRV